MSEQNFDVVVIGGGPAGYVAAIRGAQLGMNVACVDKAGVFGGTCLRVGCIPSKALLESSEMYHRVIADASTHGVSVGDVQLDLGKMLKRKDKVVTALTKGIGALFKKNGVTGIIGEAKILGPQMVQVTLNGGETQTLNANKIVIATGSEPAALRGVTFDGANIVTSTEALDFDAVPETLLVVGAGAIGLELGSVWSRLGSKVTVVEYADQIMPAADKDIADQTMKILKKQGLDIRLNSAVVSASIGTDGKVNVDVKNGDETTSEKYDKVLVAVGRRAYTANLGLESVGLVANERGQIDINAHFQTTVPTIYAIGDVVRGPMLAHKGEDEGIAVMEIIAGQAGHVNYDVIPSVVYTWPEVASVGKTEAQCQEEGIEVAVGKFPVMGNGRARAMEQKEGFVKVISEKTTDRLLGVHIVGPTASELIAEAALAMEFGGSAEDIARTCHAHPTLSEMVKEAALDANGRVIHS